jgi:hypothetical protein
MDPHAIAQEVAMELDREYFRMHPGATHYTRAHIPNEYSPQVYADGEVISVTVHQIAPGMRARVPLQRVRVKVVRKKKKRGQ